MKGHQLEIGARGATSGLGWMDLWVGWSIERFTVLRPMFVCVFIGISASQDHLVGFNWLTIPIDQGHISEIPCPILGLQRTSLHYCKEWIFNEEMVFNQNGPQYSMNIRITLDGSMSWCSVGILGHIFALALMADLQKASTSPISRMTCCFSCGLSLKPSRKKDFFPHSISLPNPHPNPLGTFLLILSRTSVLEGQFCQNLSAANF